MPEKRVYLVSFIGSNDPYSKKEAPTGGFPYGPIITTIKIAKEKGLKLSKVYILSTKGLSKNAEDTKIAINTNFNDLEVIIFDTELEDPTDHKLILESINNFINKYKEDLFGHNNDIYIALTSGTPAIHSCLLLSCASNTLPGKLIHLKEAKYTPSKLPEFRVIDLTDPSFPKISPNFSIHWQDENVETPPDSFESYNIIGNSEKLISECKKAWLYAKKRHLKSILILGETGTGKELVAELIYKASGRKSYQARNINDFSPELLRSELFGHVKGSFTGAITDKKGLLEELNGGVLFLDEIGDCSLEIQSRLLRIIEYGEFIPVGSNEVKKTDILFVFATNKDPHELVKSGKMRQDLYERIKAGTIKLPPLRERKGDIRLLVEYFLLKYNISPTPKVPPETMKKLMSYHWPGNIRELKTVLDRALSLIGNDKIISPDLIEFDDAYYIDYEKFLPEPHEGFNLTKFLEEIGNKLKMRALDIAKGNQSKAASLLGLSPQAISQFLKSQSSREHD